jgi:hypothetical protein
VLIVAVKVEAARDEDQRTMPPRAEWAATRARRQSPRKAGQSVGDDDSAAERDAAAKRGRDDAVNVENATATAPAIATPK